MVLTRMSFSSSILPFFKEVLNGKDTVIWSENRILEGQFTKPMTAENQDVRTLVKGEP